MKVTGGVSSAKTSGSNHSPRHEPVTRSDKRAQY
jgi:hypothetical protein